MSLNSTFAILNDLFIQTGILRIDDYKIKTSIMSDKNALGLTVSSAQPRFSSLCSKNQIHTSYYANSLPF